jgi:hypothetical protein
MLLSDRRYPYRKELQTDRSRDLYELTAYSCKGKFSKPDVVLREE